MVGKCSIKIEEERELKPFQPYILRHTGLTQWAPSGCDAFTLAHIATHSSSTVPGAIPANRRARAAEGACECFSIMEQEFDKVTGPVERGANEEEERSEPGLALS